jgi:tRNA nucleotidyltransferase (CCA-adding enzyme)
LSRLPCEVEVIQHIKPREQEYVHIWSVAGELVAEVDRSGIAQGMVVGSVARDTWVRGDNDLDIFMLFPPDLSWEEMEQQGLALGRKIAQKFGDIIREKYAEHPYINTTINELDVDLVPCYAVERATEIQSSVDRTPFHTRYIRNHINNYADDILLLKQFMKASGIYGSDHMTEGFAGYLCELLILFYGGFSPLIEAASQWRQGLVIDIEKHQAKDFPEPLIVVDPVDPKRNVAASLSLSRMFEFVEIARGYHENPGIDFFFPPKPPHLEQKEFMRIISNRGTYFYAMIHRKPDMVPDILVPQLRKSLSAIADMLERYGFVVNRSDCCMGEKRCMLLFELLVDELPPVKKHMGPYVWNHVNAAKFTNKYIAGTYTGPFIEDGRYYVEIERKHTRVVDLLSPDSDSPLKLGLGKHVKRTMEEGWELLLDGDIWVEEFIPFISEFLQKRSPLLRIRGEQAEDV